MFWIDFIESGSDFSKEFSRLQVGYYEEAKYYKPLQLLQ